MSKLLDRFRYFKQKGESFANGHGQVYNTNRDWEDSYRQRWQFDKIVRSTHGVNCTGFMQLEDLRQKRSGHLGNPANRLPADPPGSAQPRTPRLPARRELLLVPLQRQPSEVSAGAQAADCAVARSAGSARRSGAGVG